MPYYDMTETGEKDIWDLPGLSLGLLSVNVAAPVLWQMYLTYDMSLFHKKIMFYNLLFSWLLPIIRLLLIAAINTIADPDILAGFLVFLKFLEIPILFLGFATLLLTMVYTAYAHYRGSQGSSSQGAGSWGSNSGWSVWHKVYLGLAVVFVGLAVGVPSVGQKLVVDRAYVVQTPLPNMTIANSLFLGVAPILVLTAFVAVVGFVIYNKSKGVQGGFSSPSTVSDSADPVDKNPIPLLLTLAVTCLLFNLPVLFTHLFQSIGVQNMDIVLKRVWGWKLFHSTVDAIIIFRTLPSPKVEDEHHEKDSAESK
jgi:hypothetical protein